MFTLLYEVLLYFVPIPVSLYRVIGLRYLPLLAFGCCLYRRGEEKLNVAGMVIAFVLGIAYIAFFVVNRENTDIFRYTTWGNTNLFCCLYIVPLFYGAMRLIRDRVIPVRWLHSVISSIGRNSYYILCVQLMMFWKIGDVWSHFNVPLVVSMIINCTLACAVGVGVGEIVGRRKINVDRNCKE